MKKSALALSVCLLCLTGIHFAQQGYVMVGITQSYTHGTDDRDFLIYKLDSSGAKQWRRNLGGTENDEGFSIVRTSDGGYVAAGSTYSYFHGSFGDSDFLIYKLDAAGVKLWRKNLGGTLWDFANSIRQTSDGGYVVAGDTYSYTTGAGPLDFLIYKLDAFGVKQWRKNFGGTKSDFCECVRQTADGGYVAAGYSYSYYHGTDDSDFLIYKLDATGAKQWRKNLGGVEADRAYQVQQTTDGGYIIAGMSESYHHGVDDEDFLIYKLDAAGNKLWRKNLGGTTDDRAYSIRQTADGGYVVAGQTESYTHGNDDFLIYKLDAAGAKQWRKNMGGEKFDSARSILQTADGGYVVAGYGSSFTNGSHDFLIYKLYASGAKEWRKNFGGTDTEFGYTIIEVTN